MAADPDRPWQRRRLGRVRPAPPHHPFAGNVLYELDGEPALDLYERYLGEEDARGLPGTALLFPLLIRDPPSPTTTWCAPFLRSTARRAR